MSTSTATLVDSFQATLEPLESLHRGQSQLEAWVQDSFSALEKLHSELTEWQSELARKQTEIDLRENAISRTESQTIDGDAEEQIAHWQREFRDMRQLLEKLHSLLENRIRDSAEGGASSAGGPGAGDSNGEGTSRTAELRRRAKARLAAKLQRNKDADPSSDS